MTNWRNLFKSWILVRGQEYHECGQVVEMKEVGSIVTAEVSGNRAYYVEIHRSGERVARMSCDCPYAAGGENCKHMAAVLFALDEKTAQLRMDWQTALIQMGENQLRELLHSLAAEDGTLQDRMELYHLNGMHSELFAELSRYPYLGSFQSYEEDLRKWDSERTLKLYTEILKREMDRACDRMQYRNVATHLDKMKAYPNGQEEAKSLVAYWYVYHKNRPAMKDELKKAGYPQK